LPVSVASVAGGTSEMNAPARFRLRLASRP